MSLQSRIMDIDEIKTFLPHRYPFLFVDRVLSFDEVGIKGIKNITANEPIFMGHFPEFPVFPGVLIIEAMAQVAGIYTNLKVEADGGSVRGMKTLFTSIENAKFKRPVRPGDQLLLEANFLKTKMGIWWFTAKASVNGEVACVAEISAAFR